MVRLFLLHWKPFVPEEIFFIADKLYYQPKVTLEGLNKALK